MLGTLAIGNRLTIALIPAGLLIYVRPQIIIMDNFLLTITVIAIPLIVSTLFILPIKNHIAKSNNHFVPLFLMPLLGCIFWFLLLLTGLQPKSMSNIIELILIIVLAVFLVYLKVFCLSRSKFRKHSTQIVWLSFASIVFLMFVLIPGLPE